MLLLTINNSSMFKAGSQPKDHDKFSDTVIGEGVKLEGNFVGAGNVIIEGSVNGTLKTTGDIKIGPEATVTAEVSGNNVNIAGKVTGNVSAQNVLTVFSSASLTGDISCQEISLERGCYFSGKISMPKNIKKGEVASND